MKITILCSSTKHPIYPHLESWLHKQSQNHQISLITEINHVKDGDFLFIISFTKMVKQEILKKFKHALVIHASDLPKGRGWSPLVWQILEGATKITVSLFEAVKQVDAGNIWQKETFEVENHELFDEINEKLFKTELSLMDFAITNFEKITPIPQNHVDATYYDRRNPEDSELDPNKTISEQFDLMRVADPDRFPTFFCLRNKRYKLSLKKY